LENWKSRKLEDVPRSWSNRTRLETNSKCKSLSKPRFQKAEHSLKCWETLQNKLAFSWYFQAYLNKIGIAYCSV
jgi:hypothetical protein